MGRSVNNRLEKGERKIVGRKVVRVRFRGDRRMGRRLPPMATTSTLTRGRRGVTGNIRNYTTTIVQ